MEPLAAKELMELPRFREFLAFMATEAEKLNRLDGLDRIPADTLSTEILARAKAYATISAMLAPFSNPQTSAKGLDKNEYAV